MNTLHRFIDKQISFNRGKNLFYNGTGKILETKDSSCDFFIKISKIENDCLKDLVDYTVNQVIIELCNINQYYNFDNKDKFDLKNIYFNFIESIRENKKSIVDILENHENIFKSWLHKTNPFSFFIYKNKNMFIEPITCSEYSAEMQLSIFNINIEKLNNPILDIGCGKNGYLVEFFRNKGFECYGLDRFSNSRLHILNSNWLEYDYEREKWGTIISNLGFSNHFVHHHLRKDGNYIDYAKTYMKILKSLKYGGAFYYAPDLPFIEDLLDKKEYSINKYNINNSKYSATRIKKNEVRDIKK